MICIKCDFKYNAGVTCPSCGYDNSDQDPEQIARRQQKIYMPAKPMKKKEAGSLYHTGASTLCNECGFRFNSGKTCPSCGHTNKSTDPENIARTDAKSYIHRPKPKKWVIALSVFGIIANAFVLLVTLLALSQPASDRPLLGIIAIVQMVFNVAVICTFINLLRLKMWAVWVLRILYSIQLIILLISGELLTLKFLIGVLVALVFWLANWSDFD